MNQSYQAPQGRLLSTLALFTFILVAFYTLFLFLQNWNLNRETKRIEQNVGDLNVELSALKDEKIEALYNAQKLKDELEEESIAWSKILTKLEDLTPVSVFFSSFSANVDGSIQLNGLGDSYRAVASAIAALQSSKDFSDVFVPSITGGTTGDGGQVFSFSVTLNSAF